jgi:Na+-driven multidrug efflux pump
VVKGKQVRSFLILLLTVGANVIANALLIPPFGINGAAFASVVSYTLCGMIFLFIFRRDNSLSLSRILVVNRSDVERVGHFLRRK